MPHKWSAGGHDYDRHCHVFDWTSSVAPTPIVNGTVSGTLPSTTPMGSANSTTLRFNPSPRVSTSAPAAATGAAGSVRGHAAVIGLLALGIAAIML